MKLSHVVVALATVALMAGIGLVGCDKSDDPLSSSVDTENYEPNLSSLQAAAWPMAHQAAPGGIVNVVFGDQSATFWPYTGGNLAGDPKDPINLIFFGEADPRDIRAALLGLDGDRSAFGMPPVAPFNGTWDDAMGDVQAVYGEPGGWAPGAIQLACGAYEQVRVHLRLFKVGSYTLGGAHFELLIPGTTDHQVLSWELAEQFVTVDFIRSGLLDASGPLSTAVIHDSPFRTIPGVVYGLLPGELKDLIGNPAADAEGNYPIYTDGHATILNLVGTVPRVAEVRQQNLLINFDQAIPKPFCANGPYDIVYVTGPVTLTQMTTLGDDGTYTAKFQARGDLSVTPINPMTGEPIGETLSARVRELHNSMFSDPSAKGVSVRHQALFPTNGPGGGWLFERFNVGSPGNDGYQLITRCESDQQATQEVVASATGVDADQKSSTERLVSFR